MQIYYHRGVDKFIKTLTQQTQARTFRTIVLLEKYGSNLGMPHVKKIHSEIYELRVRGTQEVRLLYAIHRQTAYLLHGFIKKTQKTPLREIETARKRSP